MITSWFSYTPQKACFVHAFASVVDAGAWVSCLGHCNLVHVVDGQRMDMRWVAHWILVGEGYFISAVDDEWPDYTWSILILGGWACGLPLLCPSQRSKGSGLKSLAVSCWSSSSSPLLIVVVIIDTTCFDRYHCIYCRFGTFCHAKGQQPKYSVNKKLRAALTGIASIVELCLKLLPLSCQQHPPCSPDFSRLAFCSRLGIILSRTVLSNVPIWKPETTTGLLTSRRFSTFGLWRGWCDFRQRP